MGVGKTSLILLAVAALLSLLVSCGDTVYEAKGGSSGAGATTGTINVHVRDGAGDSALVSGTNGVTVTLVGVSSSPVRLTNGGVSFKNVEFGRYEVRVEKEGYATAYYSVAVDNYNDDRGETGTGSYIGGVVNLPAVLYPLNAGLTGTVLYKTPSGVTGPAVGATVVLEISLNRTTIATVEGEDVKLENRTFTTQTVAGGVYTFEGLPAIGTAGSITLKGIGKTFGGISYSTVSLPTPNGGLKSGVTTVSPTNPIGYDGTDPDALAKNLYVIGSPASVTGSTPIVFEFDSELEDIGNSVAVVSVIGDVSGQFPVSVGYEAAKLTVTPKRAWASLGDGDLTITLTNLISKSGYPLTGNEYITDPPIFILDSDSRPFALTNFNSAKQLVLKDSSDDIRLVFTKELDEDASGEEIFKNIIPSTAGVQAYRVAFDGNELVLTPVTGKWVGIGGTGLALTLANIPAADGSKGTLTGYTVLLPSKDQKFVVESATPGFQVVENYNITGSRKTIFLGENDSVHVITLKFSAPLSTRADDVLKQASAVAVTYRGKTGTPIVSFGTDDVKIDVSKGTVWQRDLVSGALTMTNTIAVSGLKSEDGVEIEAETFNVSRPATKSFGYIGKAEFTVGDTGSALISFNSKVDKTINLNSTIRLTPDQPFSATYTDNDSSILIKPFDPTYKWSFGSVGSPTPSSGVAVDLSAAVKSATGDVLVAGTVYLRPLTSSDDPMNGITVSRFILDTLYTADANANFRFVRDYDKSVHVIWNKVKDAEGYQIFAYNNDGTKVADVTVDKYLSTVTDWTTHTITKPVSWQDETVDTLAYTVNVLAGATDVLGTNPYSFAIRPLADRGASVGSEVTLKDISGRPEIITVTGAGAYQIGMSVFENDISGIGNLGADFATFVESPAGGVAGTVVGTAKMLILNYGVTVKTTDKDVKLTASHSNTYGTINGLTISPAADVTTTTDNGDGTFTLTFDVSVSYRIAATTTATDPNYFPGFAGSPPATSSITLSVSGTNSSGVPVFFEFDSNQPTFKRVSTLSARFTIKKP